MVLPADDLICPAVLKVLNRFHKKRNPDHVDLRELSDELPEGFPWKEVAEELGMEGRKGSHAVRQRCRNHLAPGLIKGPWQPDEDTTIYGEKAKGKGWVAISKLLKGRSEKSVSNR